MLGRPVILPDSTERTVHIPCRRSWQAVPTAGITRKKSFVGR